MSNWITITAQNVLGRLAQGELESYQDAGNLSGEETPPPIVDKLAEIISQVTSMVRGKVASCHLNESIMGPPGTIPPECLFAACTIARDALVGSLPIDEGASEVRKEEAREANKFLDKIATCEIKLVESLPASTRASAGGDPYLQF